MHGEIHFDNLDSLAAFLRAFCPCTALFKCVVRPNGTAVLTFDGAH